jgi:large subunit ribosomal protein L4
MPAAKAPLLDSSGKKAKELTLEAAAFGAEVKPHLVHEAVRAELNAARAGTKGTKSRGLVSGGRAKPWRQKGTGRARAGTTRAPHWTGGGVAFAPGMRSFEVKVNRKAAKAALRSALASHAAGSSIAILDSSGFGTPSTKLAAGLVEAWGVRVPLLVVTTEDEVGVIKSFRNLEKVLVTIPSELEVSALVWARSLLVTEGALEQVVARAQNGKAAS